MIQTGQRSTMNDGEKILGVEGGGTNTSWVVVERAETELRVLDQGKLPPANFRLAEPDQLRAMFRELPKEIARAGIFLAGCGTEEDRQSLTRLCAEVWPQRLVIAMELSLTPEAVRPSLVAETSESRTPVDGDTFWVMPEALIFSA